MSAIIHPAQILLLEDSELDAELLGEHLRRGGIEHETHRVWTRSDFTQALQSQRYDLILADYALPSFDGMSALKIAHATVPDTPFIFVSGTLGEETAIESLKRGAIDYVVKQRLSRLPAAVTRAFEEAEERAARKRAERRLAEINADLEATVEERTRERDRIWRLSQDLFAVFNLDGTVRSANPAWTSILGLEPSEVEGKHHTELKHPDDREKGEAGIARLQHGETVTELEDRYRHKDGSYRWISWKAAAPEGDLIYAIGRDVTAAKEQAETLARAEAQLHQVQKMESIGQLTGGVAHDFNNLLTVVIGNLETLQRHRNDATTDRERSAIENAMRGAQRAAKLTQSLLAFSRRQPLEPKQVEVNRLVEGMSDLLGRTLGEHLEIETVLAGGLWWTHADPNQLENAILNLAVNARDAMAGGGKLTIETCNTHLDEAYCEHNLDAVPGQYVVICVSDTGSGMDAEVIAQVFEPFFTTKGIGEGTGLGLSQVYGFVKQSGGHVKIYSEPGQGTTVKLYLPRLLVVEDEARRTAEQPSVPAGARHETVLVVEDDEDVRRHSTSIVRELGYEVLEAPDGPTALHVLDRHPEVRLLFTDVGLPNGMNGRQLADEACRRRPGLKVLFATAYARNAIVHGGRLDPGVQLITKPYTFATLATRLRSILDARKIAPCVLVVEDEMLVRMIAVDTLEDAGCRVEEAGSAAEALSKMRIIDGGIDAAVVDIGLPDRKGDALAAEMRAMRSDLPIVIASGYDGAEIRQRFNGDSLIGFVGKPYDGGQLVESLRKLGILLP